MQIIFNVKLSRSTLIINLKSVSTHFSTCTSSPDTSFYYQHKHDTKFKSANFLHTIICPNETKASAAGPEVILLDNDQTEQSHMMYSKSH